MMDTISAESETKMTYADSKGTSGQAVCVDNGRRVHQFQPGLGDHPLWPAFMEELKAQREADIAESNRLADLELENLEQK
jgi:hypothetical protein